MLYFDHNATTPLLPEARQAWLEAVDNFPGNPSSPHRLGARAEAAIDQAREVLASHLGCDPFDLVWTSSATESSNTVFYHASRTLASGAEVLVSSIEHPCVLAAAQRYFPQRHQLIPVSRDGVIDLAWLTEHLKAARPGLVVVMAANNETGVLQPWQDIAQLCRSQGVPYFCDAAQWVGKMPGEGLGACDFVSGCAHKFGGPKGVGFLKTPGARLQPLLVGGPQEDGHRAGTENVPAIVATAAALEACRPHQALNESRLGWRAAFEEASVQKLPGAQIMGRGQARLWNTVSARMPPTNCPQRWVVRLDRLGVAVSTGSACASGKETPSHVITAMGYDAAAASSVLRFSSGWSTTAEDWATLLLNLEKARDALMQPEGAAHA